MIVFVPLLFSVIWASFGMDGGGRLFARMSFGAFRYFDTFAVTLLVTLAFVSFVVVLVRRWGLGILLPGLAALVGFLRLDAIKLFFFPLRVSIPLLMI